MILFIEPAFAQEVNPSDMTLEELMNVQVVASSKYEQNPSQAYATVSVITSQEISHLGLKNLSEALNLLMGFSGSTDRIYSYAGVRGFAMMSDCNDRILLMLNNHILNENVYGGALLGSELGINLDMIDRIEVVRGPGSALYGTGAMTGVINLITKSSNNAPFIQLNTRLGSLSLKNTTLTVTKRIKNTEIFIGGNWEENNGENFYFKELDNPLYNNGISRGNDWEKLNGFYTKINNDKFTFSFFTTGRKKGVPTGTWNTLLDGKTQNQDYRQYAEIEYKPINDRTSKLVLKSFIDHYKFYGIYSNPGKLSFDQSIGLWYGVSSDYYYNPSPKSNILVGGEFRYNPTSNYKQWDEKIVFDKNKPFYNYSIYAQYDWNFLPKFHLLTGGRFDDYQYSHYSISPRLGLQYHLNEQNRFKLIYSEAFRSPNFNEQYYESPGENISNTALKPEKIRNKEFIWEYEPNHFISTSISIYHYKMRNLIDQVELDNGIVQFQNFTNGTGQGIDARLRFQFSDDFIGALSYSLQKITIGKDNNEYDATNYPRHQIKTSVIYTLPEILHWGINGVFETQRKTNADQYTRHYILFNTNISSVRILSHWQVALKINNLFNKRYLMPVGFEFPEDSIIQPGRTIQGLISLIF
ncbi:MAG: TonB-dependent receptor [Bacteroidota bacterium]|nr:TonB-dependent receptor [Bacteroidota bacterium]